MLIKMVKDITSRRIRAKIKASEAKRRFEAEQKLPKVFLDAEHVSDCRLIPGRSDLLAMIPKRSVIAELGVNMGDFSSEILKICEPKQLHLIDIWGSERYHDDLFEGVKDRFKEQIENGTVVIHRMLSVEAANLFTDDFFDFVYIDTVHDYPTTRDELRAYAPKLKPDGILAGHDYNKGNWVKGLRYGVIEAVHEFAKNENWKLAAITANYPESPSFALQRLAPDS